MVEPVRVLQVFAQMNRGGAETMIMNLYRNIDRSKVQFDFIVHTEEKCAYDDEIEQLGGKIYRIPKYTGKNHFIYGKSWRDFFNSHSELKVVHGHVRSTASIYLNIAKKFKITTITHSHNTSSGKGVAALIKDFMQLPIRYTADYFFACSNYAGKWLFGNKILKKSNKNYFLLNNAIDTEQFVFNNDIKQEKRNELNLADKFIVGHIGRFHPQKNHKFLIDIFKSIHDLDDNSVLILVGSGTLKSEIERQVNSLGLSNSVIFLGVRSDIRELLQAMDVFLFPSLHEGLPVTLVEAQASGLPCVISNNITDEIKITNLVDSLDLNESSEVWAERVIKYKTFKNRKDTSYDIKKAGYDIKSTAKWYENFMLKLQDNL